MSDKEVVRKAIVDWDGNNILASVVQSTTDPTKYGIVICNPDWSPIWWGWSGTVESIVAWTGIVVDNTDPANPIVSVDLIVGGMIRNQTSDISSTTLTLLDTNLTFPVEANSVYALQWWLIGGGNSSGWIRIALSLPAGCSWRHGVGISANINIGITSAISPFAPANNTQQTIYHGTLITGANAGTVTLQFSSANAGQTWWFRTDSILYIAKK